MVFSCGGERLLRIMQCCAHASKCVLRICSAISMLASVCYESCSAVSMLASVCYEYVVLCLCQQVQCNNHVVLCLCQQVQCCAYARITPLAQLYSLSLPFVLFFILHHQPDLLGKRPLQYSNVDNWPISSVDLYYTIHGVIPIYCKIIKAFPLLYYTIHGVIPNYVIIPFHSSTKYSYYYLL